MSEARETNKIYNFQFIQCPLLGQIVSELNYENKQLKHTMSEIIETINKIDEPKNGNSDQLEYLQEWSSKLEIALSDIETALKKLAAPNNNSDTYKKIA